MVARINCNVPGTRVWINGHDLGRTPAKITLATLRWLNLPVAGHGGFIRLRYDDWGRCFLLESPDWQEKIMFQPPPRLADLFEPIPTPWATCAQIIPLGYSAYSGTREVALCPSATPQVQIRCYANSTYTLEPAGRLIFHLIICNKTQEIYRGRSAKLKIHWTAFSNRWFPGRSGPRGTIGNLVVDLSQKFAVLLPKTQARAVIAMAAPRVPGQYCFRIGYELFALRAGGGALLVGEPYTYALVNVRPALFR